MSGRAGSDVGGTFTDLVWQDSAGGVRLAKVLSSPPTFEAAVITALQQAGASPGDTAEPLTELVHGTTVATNAVLERKGATTALVTTEGFRDVLELRRMRMPHLYDYLWEKPRPLVPRRLRFEVSERTSAKGEILMPVDLDQVAEIAQRIRDAQVQSVAVCFLHAHRYPENERIVGAALREALPDVPVSLSSEILREEQEYERTATTCVNAYVRPLMGRYLADLSAGVSALADDVTITVMQSSGGVTPASDASLRPVFALESGPAAGVVAAAGLAELLGLTNVIAFDMGGTTAKASLIEDGRVSHNLEYEVGSSLSVSSRLLRGSGELIRIPTIEIAEVGAGGGSLGWLDAAGELQVGPSSAGANPGPACYGLGGQQPTVTDANVVLGLIAEKPLASGDLRVDATLAREAIEKIAEPLSLTAAEAAHGIRAIANATMMRALRAVSTEKGRDARDFALLAYGGSGPLHAADLATELGISTVIIPPLAGVFSAAGLLFARPQFDDVRFCRLNAREPDISVLQALEQEMRTELGKHAGRYSEVSWTAEADFCYRGQSWTISVDVPLPLDSSALEVAVASFEAEYYRQYATQLEADAPIEIRALRLRATGPRQRPLRSLLPRDLEGPELDTGSRRVNFGAEHGQIDVPLTTRKNLADGVHQGPLLIDEYDSTIIVPPNWAVTLHESGTLVLNAQNVTPRRAETAQVDTVTRQVAANGLAAIADEMATTIYRTAHSTVVRDAMDFSAALCGPTGETVAQAVTIPLQLGSIPHAMKALFERFGDRFAPGDIYMVNDPFDGASHTPDIFVVKPIFFEEELIGFSVSVAHHADLGGRVPGTIACDNTEVFQEGLRIPWTRLYADDQPVEAIFTLIRANVRSPRETIGDLNAQVSACNMGERGLQSLAERYGASVLAQIMTGLLDQTETVLRAEIAGWPDGSVEFWDYLDSDGIELMDVLLHVRVTVRGDELVADFSKSAPMVRGALNCTPSFVEASTYQTVMAACSNSIPSTSGVTRPIRVITKPGTVTHVLLPAASSQRGITGYRLADVMNGALAQIIPDRVPAAGEGGSTLAFFSGRANGDAVLYSELIVGTWGGRPILDGNDGLANPCASIANISIEYAESNWPIHIERYGLVNDSGGGGRFRGGLAVERAWRILDHELALQVRSDRQIHRPYGLNGGLPGRRSYNFITTADGTRSEYPPMFGVVLSPGDRYHHQMPGGGGWGDPLDRDPKAVLADVLDEKVSLEMARSTYGVIIEGDAVDVEATIQLRRAQREASASSAKTP